MKKYLQQRTRETEEMNLLKNLFQFSISWLMGMHVNFVLFLKVILVTLVVTTQATTVVVLWEVVVVAVVVITTEGIKKKVILIQLTF